jgi:hypothetical protein
MTQAEIRAILPTFVAPFFYDTSYAKPTNDWLFLKFWPWFKQQRKELGLDVWDRRNDCDNFAHAYVAGAHDAHALTAGNDAEGLAVGEFCYHGTTHVQGPHAIVAAVTEDGLIFIEPQTGQRLALTPTEIQSCFRVSF